MEKIDWDKAPEWATKHGYAGPDRHEVWMDDCKYTYCDGRQGGIEFHFGGGFASRSIQEVSCITERPSKSWNGEGLPPVGVVCEVENEELGGWDAVDSILAHAIVFGGGVAVFQIGNRIAYAKTGSFRPIRTPEQIAADEREAAIKSLAELIGQEARCAGSPLKPGTCLCIARTLVIDGYRKQDAK